MNIYKYIYSYINIYVCVCVCVCVKLATVVENGPKVPFSIATTPKYSRGRYRISPFYT